MQLRQIWLGLANYHDACLSLPPAYVCDSEGKPIHSWHAVVMPFYGYYSWRIQYNIKEPWDSPNNSKYHLQPLHLLHCPRVNNPSESIINYVTVVGPETMWPGRDRVKLPPKKERNGDTILLIEMPDSDYRCFEPRCPTVEEFMAKIKSPTGKGIRTIHRRGLAYLTVGGEVRWFPPETEPESIRKLLVRDPKCEVIPARERMEIVDKWGEWDNGKGNGRGIYCRIGEE